MGDTSECSECHELKATEADMIPVNPATFLTEKGKAKSDSSTCYSCHNNITTYPYVHGPASVWS